MAWVDYGVAGDGLAEHESLSNIDNMVTQRFFGTQSKWLTTMGAHSKIREPYCGFPLGPVTTAMAFKKIVGGKRRCPTHLMIDNSEPPRHRSAWPQPADHH